MGQLVVFVGCLLYFWGVPFAVQIVVDKTLGKWNYLIKPNFLIYIKLLSD